MTEVGLEPTGTRLSTWPLCQFAYPVISGGSGSCTRAVQAYEARLSLRPPAQLQAPVSSRAHRPYESQLGTCRACNVSVTTGRIELPRLTGTTF